LIDRLIQIFTRYSVAVRLRFGTIFRPNERFIAINPHSDALTCGSVVWRFMAASWVSRALLDLPSVRKMTTTGTPSSWRPCCSIMSVAEFSPAAEFVPAISNRDVSAPKCLDHSVRNSDLQVWKNPQTWVLA